MVAHYKLELVKSKAVLKVSYRNGKWFKLEQLRGKLNAEEIKHISRLIPPLETDLELFVVEFLEQATYTPIKSEKTLFSQFNGVWFTFYQNLNNIPPRFNAAEGNALKQIITYLKSIEPNDADALLLWQTILSNWHRLPEFYRSNADLKFINSQLNKIIQHVKGSNQSTEQVFKSAMESQTAKGFKFK